MPSQKISLASDNWSPAHPSILQAVTEANTGYAPAYGGDHWTETAQALIQENFKRKCKVFLVPTGTGANIFAFRLACKPFESVLCTDIAHINYQESGAVEALAGCKLLTVPHEGGKITPNTILKKLKSERAFGKHSTSPRVLSITQPTEIGAVYTLKEIEALSKLCREEGLLLHMDGSRYYNAAISLGLELHEMATTLDLLSLGGTKNGLMGAEALLIFNPELEAGSDHLHKQTLLLLSKMRYLAAQYIPFFKEDLWKTLAKHANEKAKELASILKNIPQVSLSYSVETNQLFFTIPAPWIPLLQEKIFCHVWNQEKNEIRFITSWNTTDHEILMTGTIFKELSKHSS